jgi:hypothetical protein
MKFLTILSLAFVITGCSSSSYDRSPSSIEKTRISLLVDQISSTFNQGLPVNSCIAAADDFYTQLYGLTYENSDINEIVDDSLLLERTFESRLIIRNYIKNLSKNFKSIECVKGIRNLTRALRYLEDYLTNKISIGQKIEDNALVPSGVQLLVNSNYSFDDYNDLESGDIIISRGNAFSSAAIARIGITDSQFSHMSFVYRDENNQLQTIEAHIEVGSVASEFQNHLNQKNTRAVVYRYKDQKLAHKAAKHMFNKVKNFSKSNKANINYDFGMDYKSNTELFCSEVVYDGFQYASVGETNIPYYKTQFDSSLIKFLNQIGVRVNKSTISSFDTFSPGDIEYDTRFDLVAEWRNPEKVVSTRIRDAILTKMFDWISTKDYQLKSGFSVTTKSYLAYFARRVPLLKKSYIEKFPLNMSPKQMRLFLILDEVGDVLEKQITQKKNFKTLSFEQMYDILEGFRKKDLRYYKNGKRKLSTLHKLFRP